MAIGLERWRSSFFASPSRLRTYSFFKNWDGVGGGGTDRAVRAVRARDVNGFCKNVLC